MRVVKLLDYASNSSSYNPMYMKDNIMRSSENLNGCHLLVSYLIFILKPI